MRLRGACEPLLECATGNRNILHVCCEAGNATVEMRQSGTDSVKEGGGRSWSVGKWRVRIDQLYAATDIRTYVANQLT